MIIRMKNDYWSYTNRQNGDVTQDPQRYRRAVSEEEKAVISYSDQIDWPWIGHKKKESVKKIRLIQDVLMSRFLTDEQRPLICYSRRTAVKNTQSKMRFEDDQVCDLSQVCESSNKKKKVEDGWWATNKCSEWLIVERLNWKTKMIKVNEINWESDATCLFKTCRMNIFFPILGRTSVFIHCPRDSSHTSAIIRRRKKMMIMMIASIIHYEFVQWDDKTDRRIAMSRVYIIWHNHHFKSFLFISFYYY